MIPSCPISTAAAVTFLIRDLVDGGAENVKLQTKKKGSGAESGLIKPEHM
jgi:hypothetical protein